MHTSTRFFARSLAAGALAVLALSATRAAAQDAVAPADADHHHRLLVPVVASTDSTAATPATASAPAAAPSLAGARAAVSAPVAASNASAATAVQARGGLQQSQVLMIVGGAAIVLGLLVDNDASDVLVVVGAGVGLWGLYQYLKTNN